jgi:hypothetical protein
MDNLYAGGNALPFRLPIEDPVRVLSEACIAWETHGFRRDGERNEVRTCQMQVSAACHFRKFALTEEGHLPWLVRRQSKEI